MSSKRWKSTLLQPTESVMVEKEVKPCAAKGSKREADKNSYDIRRAKPALI